MLLILAALSACTGPAGQQDSGDTATVDDTGASSPPECADLGLVALQSFGETDLVDPAEVQGDLGTGGPGLALGDLDGDGDLDLVMAVPVAPSLVLHNDGTGHMTITETELPPANAVSLADPDGDGDLDIWLGTGASEPDQLARSDGSGLGYALEALPGTPGESYGGTWADLDGDGDDDLVVARFASFFDVIDWSDPTFELTENQLLRNDGGSLVDATADALPADTLLDPSFHAQVLDAEGDGDLDIYLSNDFGMLVQPNRLLLNQGAGSFVEAQDCACDLAIFGMGAAAGDIDGDGDDDLYATNLGGPVLLRGDGDGRFVDATLASAADIPAAPDALASWGSSLVDLDGDGDQDLAVTFGKLLLGGEDLDSYAGAVGDDWVDGDEQPDHLLLNQGDGSFDDASAAAGFQDARVGRAVVVGDLDRDGRPDLVTAGVPYLQVWHTEGGCGPGITVQGLPVGATVTVSVGGGSWSTRHLPSTSFSSSAPELVVGLAGHERAERVVVEHMGQVLLDRSDVAAGDRLVLEP